MSPSASRALPLLAALVACSAPPRPGPPAPPRAASEAPRERARWLLTDRLGVTFDEAGEGVAHARVEPAIVDGVRMLVEGSRLLGGARHGERLRGFRSLPERLGGGFVFWSEDRVYRAARFLDELVPIADVGVTGGARPWLGSVLLRTGQGLFELDPRSLALRRAPFIGVADAVAVDGRRAARLDHLGRAVVTSDGGKTWVDVLATHGARTLALREWRDYLHLVGGSLESFYLGKDGVLGTTTISDPLPHEARVTAPLLDAAWPSSSRAFPSELLGHAVASGALLPGGRALAMREEGLRVVSLATGLTIAEVKLASVEDRLARCQPIEAGAPPRPLLACAAEDGALVLALEEGLARPSLEATFPGPAGGFLHGPRGQLAFDGRCGPRDPRPSDLRLVANGSSGNNPPPPPFPVADLPPADEAHVCLRGAASWIERRLAGDDARRLYRWIPGEDGAVTALVLGGDDDDAGAKGADAGPAQAAFASEGVRLIRVDPRDPALDGGVFPALRPPRPEAPYRVTDGDFWEERDGSIRGWIRLPAEGAPPVIPPASAQGPAKRILPVASGRGGRLTGVRIGADGHVITLGLPASTTEVVTGGPFAVALAERDAGPAWFETTDGGVTWTPIEGPPVGRIEPPGDETTPFGCSPMGCALGNGLVRVGWGSAPPQPAPAPSLAPAKNAKPRALDPLAIHCRLDAPAPWIGGAEPAARSKPRAAPARADVTPKPPAPPAPLGLRRSPPALGEIRDRTWSAEVMLPFQPAAPSRRLSARAPSLTQTKGTVVPLLPAGRAAPVDLLFLFDGWRTRASAATALLPFAPRGRFTVAAEIGDGRFALLDTERWQIIVAREGAAAPVTRLGAVADAWQTRLTLGQRARGGLAIVGYSAASGEVFAGDLEPGLAEVGPLAALGRLDAIGAGDACAARATHRFLLELPVAVELDGRRDPPVLASLLVESSGAELCLQAIEVALSRDRSTVLSATFGRGAVASVRRGEASARATCALRLRSQ